MSTDAAMERITDQSSTADGRFPEPVLPLGMRIRRSLPLMMALSSLPACSDGGDTGCAIPLSTYRTRVSDVDCTRLVRCGLFPDKAACEAVLSAMYEAITALIVPKVNAGRIHYECAAAIACLDGMGKMGCDLADLLSSQTAPQECKGVFTGLVPEGAPCLLDVECASGFCSLPSTCSTGVCATPSPLTPIAFGDSCSSTKDCVGGYCNSNDICTPKAALGEACDTRFLNESCAVGLCTGICGGTPAAEGQPCSPSPSFACNAFQDYCDPTTHTCTPKVAVGGSCATDIPCVDYAYCDLNNHSCASMLRPGQACVANQVPDCMSYGHISCVNGTCAPTPASNACP